VPNLGDYIGQLLTEITVARMKADLEAIRIAELYASHPLLRHMPVPHFRLPEIQLEVPISVPQADGGAAAAPPPKAPEFNAVVQRFHAILDSELQRQGVQLTDEKRVAVGNAIAEAGRNLDLPDEIAVDTNRIADGLTASVMKILHDVVPQTAATKGGGPDPIATLRDSLRAQARLDLLKTKAGPARLNVLVTSQEVREAGPQNIMRLNLKITEENVEWTAIETDGESTEKLVHS